MNLENDKYYTIMRDKVSRMIAGSEQSIKKAILDFKQLATSIEDTIFTNGENNLRMQFQQSSDGITLFLPSDGIHVQSLAVHPLALSQIATKLGTKGSIITDYMSGERWKRELAAYILNEHSMHTDKRFLARVVDNQLRGFLSEKYKRFDSGKIIAQFLISATQAQLMPVSSHVGDTKIFFECIHPQVFAIPTKNNSVAYVVFGARLAISDFGDGAMDLRKFMIQVSCWNGMTRETVMREIHLGGRIEADFEVSQETFMLETAARTSAVRDVMKSMFSRDSILSEVNDIKKASEIIVPASKIQELDKKGMYQSEVKMLEEYLMASRIEDGVSGELSLWKLSQGIGAVARDVDERRRRDLNDLAGLIFSESFKK